MNAILIMIVLAKCNATTISQVIPLAILDIMNARTAATSMVAANAIKNATTQWPQMEFAQFQREYQVNIIGNIWNYPSRKNIGENT